MTIKRIFALLLALLMVAALGATVFAVEGDTEGTTETTKTWLTIDEALKGNSYSVYKIFTLESYDKVNKHYSYTIEKDSPLYDTVKNMNIGGTVFTLTDKNDKTSYVKLAQSGTDELMKEIASRLMAAITANGIQPVQQVNNLGTDAEQKLPEGADITVAAVPGKADRFDVTFSGLGEGYFMVDTSAGTMFALNTTDPNVTITAKNKLPSVKKEVKRNSDRNWAAENSKCIGEKVEFRVQVNVVEGATNYKLYDIISDGLTYGSITKVYYADKFATDDSKYMVYNAASTNKKDMTPYFDYVATGVQHEEKAACFQITFKDEFLQKVLDNNDVGGESGLNTTIYIEYEATVNAQAVIADGYNPNEIHMTYGNNNVEVTKSTTKTFVYQAELVKTDDNNVLLPGAKFELYKRKNGTALEQQLSFVVENDGGKTVYRIATAAEIEDENVNTVTEIEAGDVIIRGLGGNFPAEGNNTPRVYYLKEIAAPVGYNLLDKPAEIKITNANEMADFADDGKYLEKGVQVINKTGTKLPSTGGIGTTIFYVVGGLLVLAAVVLLVTRKRVGAAQDAQI